MKNVEGTVIAANAVYILKVAGICIGACLVLFLLEYATRIYAFIKFRNQTAEYLDRMLSKLTEEDIAETKEEGCENHR